MAVSGDYLTPRNDWVRYFEKPPLVYWLTAASLKAFGTNELAVRLQAAGFSAAQVGITAALGEAIFGVTAGLLAALALALSPLFFVFARFATPDPALAFFFTTALACFYRASVTPSFKRGSGRRWMLLASAALALGDSNQRTSRIAPRGRDRTGLADRRRPHPRRAPDARGYPAPSVYLAIALPWFVIVAERNPGFLTFFIIHEHLHRYLANAEHGWGPVVLYSGRDRRKLAMVLFRSARPHRLFRLGR